MTEELKCYICETHEPPLLPFPFGSILFEWLNTLEIKITEYNLQMRLCSLHFEEKYLRDSRRRLTKDAIPTLFLGPGGSVKEPHKKAKFKPRVCSIPGCKSTSSSGFRMFAFPTDERRNAWKEATGLESSSKRTLQACLLHFHAMYVNNTRLDRSAVPMFGVHPTQSWILEELKNPTLPKATEHSKEIIEASTVIEDDRLSKSRYFCSVPGCESNNLSDYRMFGFPNDDRRQIWLESVGLNSTKRARLFACVLHFDAKLVNNTRLLKDAVPILGVHPSQNRHLGIDDSDEDPEEVQDSSDAVEIIDEPDSEVRTSVSKQCSVPGCKTNNLSNLRIFSFPTDERGQVWRESVGKANSKRKRLFACLLHFDRVHVNNTRLDRNAVPILGVHPSQVHWLEPLKPDNNLNTLQDTSSQDTSNRTDSIDLEDDDIIEEILDDDDDEKDFQENVQVIEDDILELDDVDIEHIDSPGSFENVQDSSSSSAEPQAIINKLGIRNGFLPGTRTIVRIVEKPPSQSITELP